MFRGSFDPHGGEMRTRASGIPGLHSRPSLNQEDFAAHGRRRPVRLARCLLIALAVILVCGTIEPAVGHAADGAILRTITAQNYNCSAGTGIAFDGTNLLLSCDDNNTITAVSPTDGTFVRSYTISGVPAIAHLLDGRRTAELTT